MNFQNNYWLRSGFINILQNFSGLFLSFGGFYFLVRILTKDQFGTWTLFLSITSIIELTRNGLIQNALIKHLASANRLDKMKIVTASAVINVTFTLIVFLLLILLAHLAAELWGAPVLQELFYLYGIVFLITCLQTQFNCIEQANFSFKGVFAANLSRQLLFFLFIAFCFISNYHTSLITLFLALIVSSLFSTFISAIYAMSYLKYTKLIDWVWVKKLLDYGKYTVGTSISSLLSGNLDQMMLGAMLSPVAAGSFNIAVRITNLANIPTNAVSTIVFPQTAKRMETQGAEGIKYLYEKSVGTILALLMPALTFMYFFSDIVIHLIAGEKYNDTLPLLKVTLLYSILMPFGRQVGTIFDAIGKTKLNFVLVLITAALNIILNFFLIRKYGVMGAAYASLWSGIIGYIISQIILKRMLGVSLLNPWIYAVKFYPEFYHKFIKKDAN